MRLISLLTFSVLLTALSGCAAGSSPASGSAMASISGTLTYRQRIALPADAQVIVRLADVSRADAPAILMGEHSFVAQHQVPLPFTVEYDAGAILDTHIYALQAEIRDAQGELLFRNTTIYPAIIGGQVAESVEIILDMVSGQ
ncbi:MAG: YbaY family lipoprotein [Anaerolineales bacterium]|nr:YbaY family lipoprotein [Anaerolineales bacterium]